MYLRPDTVEQALHALAAQRWSLLAGGTDFYPARVGRPVEEPILDLSRLAALRRIDDTGEHWRIGALCTWTQVLEKPLPPLFDGLKLAAREVGGAQIQNAGTIAGNLCNASPAADGVPPLMALDAQVELASAQGVRSLPLTEFITGNRQTQRRADELVTAITVPKWNDTACSTFLKLGARKYLVISIAMAAVVLETDADVITRAGIAVGACSAVAQRLTDLERKLIGRARTPALAELATADNLATLTPIDDVRASAAYRLDAALVLVKRALLSVV